MLKVRRESAVDASFSLHSYFWPYNNTNIIQSQAEFQSNKSLSWLFSEIVFDKLYWAESSSYFKLRIKKSQDLISNMISISVLRNIRQSNYQNICRFLSSQRVSSFIQLYTDKPRKIDFDQNSFRYISNKLTSNLHIWKKISRKYKKKSTDCIKKRMANRRSYFYHGSRQDPKTMKSFARFILVGASTSLLWTTPHMIW